MKTDEAVRMLEQARDDLLEARRYLSRDLAASESLLSRAMRAVNKVLPAETGDRLVLNLTVAYNARQVDPDVTRGYIDGVRHELSILRRAAEKLAGD